jgi:hypothetical protein
VLVQLLEQVVASGAGRGGMPIHVQR